MPRRLQASANHVFYGLLGAIPVQDLTSNVDELLCLDRMVRAHDPQFAVARVAVFSGGAHQ